MYFVGYCQIPLHCSFPAATYVSVFPHSPCFMFQGYLHFFFCELSGHLSCSFFKKRFYLFIFREGKGERKRGRETSMCGRLSGTPYQGPGLQARHVPWLGIEPLTLWFAGRHSIYWATPAKGSARFLRWRVGLKYFVWPTRMLFCWFVQKYLRLWSRLK